MCRKLNQERKAEKNESEDFWRCGNFIHFGRSVLRCCFYYILQQFAWVEKLGSGDCFEYFPEMPCFARPNALKCPKILVNKQFYCPDNLRECSFSWQMGGRLALPWPYQQLRKQLARHQKNPFRILELEEEYQLTQRQQDSKHDSGQQDDKIARI